MSADEFREKLLKQLQEKRELKKNLEEQRFEIQTRLKALEDELKELECALFCPFSLAVTPANVADSVVAPSLVRQIKSRVRELRPKHIIGDPGYNSREMHVTIVTLGAAPIIKLNPRRRGVNGVREGRSYRLYPGVPLDPKAWQKHYNKRTAVERVNSRLKEFAKLDNLKVRVLAKIQLHGLLDMLMLQAKAVATVASL